MVQMFGTVTGVTVLAVADRESVSGYREKIVASPGSSVGGPLSSLYQAGSVRI